MIRDSLGVPYKKTIAGDVGTTSKGILHSIMKAADGYRCVAFKPISSLVRRESIPTILHPRRNFSMSNCHHFAQDVTMSVTSKKTRKVNHIIASSACKYCAVDFGTDDLTSLASLNDRYHGSEKCIYRAEQGWNPRPFQTFQTAFTTEMVSTFPVTPCIIRDTMEYALHERKSSLLG